MAYKSIVNSDEGAEEQLLNKKEYYSLKLPPISMTQDDAVDSDLFAGSMQLQSYQMFGKNYVNPNTKHKRLLAKWQTGVGKSLFALAVANEFVKYYKLDENPDGPSVFVIGFSRALPRELLKFPEFGIITEEEVLELERLRKIAVTGTSMDAKIARDYRNRIKRRIYNREQGGYYKEYGYQQFVYRLFNITDDDLFKSRNTTIDESALEEMIASGKIQVNTTLLESMKNSLIICDEIHNVYNTEKKNNWGIAIQYVLDYHERQGNAIYAIFMSATPINNSPSEIVDMLNLLLPPSKKIKKSDFFTGDRQLRPNKLEELGRLSHGLVSFIQDIDTRYYPERILMGDICKMPEVVDGLAEIPYLKFIPCPLSRLHYKTFESLPECIVPTDGKAINSIVYPSPNDDNIGLYRTEEIFSRITYANEEWRAKKEISVVQKGGNRVITGNFLELSNIGTYSTKFKTLVVNVLNILRETPRQKIMIYDDKVKTAGVIQVRELLLRNHIIDEYSEPSPLTPCSICGKTQDAHTITGLKSKNQEESQHKFYPVRFVIVHSDIDRELRERAIDKFNATENTHGMYYSIIVGSKIIQESYDLKAVCHMFLITRPTNIPTMMQIFGRAVRKGSHALTQYKFTKIYLLLNTFDEKYWEHENDPNYVFICGDSKQKSYTPPPNTISTKITEEMRRFAEKINDFITIQEIERQIHINAMDAAIHKSLILPQGRNIDTQDSLSNLQFTPLARDREYKLSELDVSTYLAYDYAMDEIKIINWIIKILFIQQPAWTYDDLWNGVKNYKYRVKMRNDVFSEENFKIALNNLTRETYSTSQIHSIFNYDDKYIIRPGYDVKHKIVPIINPDPSQKIIYVLFPVEESIPIIDIEPYNIHEIKSTEMILSVDRLTLNVDFKDYRKTFESEYGKLINADTFVLFLGDYNREFHIAFMMYLIESKETLKPIYAKALEVYVNARLILTVSSIMESNTKSAWDEPLEPSTPIAYIQGRSVRLFTKYGWKDISMTAIKYIKGVTDLTENTVIVGFMDNDIMKLRSASKEQKDVRLIERGIVCISKKKEQLEKTLDQLEDISGIKMKRNSNKIKNICTAIKFQLIQLQLRTYAQMEGMRYFYFVTEIA